MSPSKRVALVLLVIAASIAACSSDDTGTSAPATCDANPFQCPAGQTCWVTPQLTFKCFNSGGGKEGDTCMNTPGVPSCEDGLDCFQTTPAGGTCTSYCDTAHPCAGGLMCIRAQIPGGPIFNICNPPAPQPDGGTLDGGVDGAPMDSASPDSAPDAPSDATGQ